MFVPVEAIGGMLTASGYSCDPSSLAKANQYGV
jgi:hypothetical protein